ICLFCVINVRYAGFGLNLQPDDLKAYFKWVSQSIKQTSQSVAQVMADDQPITLPPPPPGITIIP
ncbi:MAG: hypothetical protein ACKPE3_08590, partial [Sphaerospermopsis kisseleviana]